MLFSPEQWSSKPSCAWKTPGGLAKTDGWDSRPPPPQSFPFRPGWGLGVVSKALAAGSSSRRLTAVLPTTGWAFLVAGSLLDGEGPCEFALFSNPLLMRPTHGPSPCPSGGRLPDDVALEEAVLVVLRGRLPLDHDGLVRPAAGDDVLRRGGGGLLGERDPGEGNTGRGWVFPHSSFRGQTQEFPGTGGG